MLIINLPINISIMCDYLICSDMMITIQIKILCSTTSIFRFYAICYNICRYLLLFSTHFYYVIEMRLTIIDSSLSTHLNIMSFAFECVSVFYVRGCPSVYQSVRLKCRTVPVWWSTLQWELKLLLRYLFRLVQSRTILFLIVYCMCVSVYTYAVDVSNQL